MTIKTYDGEKVRYLPDSARCMLTGESPRDMEECPACKWDMFGDVCIPGYCTDYTERED